MTQERIIPIELPDFSLVVLIGASGCGKSTFARHHFLETEIVSSDHFRALVADDETDQTASTDAFEALHYLAAIRLRRRKRVIVDATNVQAGARKPLIELARRFHAIPVAIVLDVPERLCHERNQSRPNRNFGKHVVERHVRDLRQSLRNLRKEGFRHVWHLDGVEEIAAARITPVPLRPDKRHEIGPFDIIGDVHGCYDELCDLLTQLGYPIRETGVFPHPDSRRLIFVGDLVDRGLKSVEVCRLVMDAVAAGNAFCVPGNHDDKLKRVLERREKKDDKSETTGATPYGRAVTLTQIESLPDEERPAFVQQFIDFVEALPTHLWLEHGNLVVAHAGLPEATHGRSSGELRSFASRRPTGTLWKPENRNRARQGRPGGKPTL